MTGQIQPRPSGSLARPMMPMAPLGLAQPVITPHDVWGIVLRHWLMIVLFTICGMVLGIGSYIVLLKLRPAYTSKSQIEVLPQGEKDPTTIGNTVLNKDIQFQFRSTKAAILKNESFLMQVINLDKIRETNWFSQCRKPFLWNKPSEDHARLRALKYLKKNFKANPNRDTNFIDLELRCYGNSGKDESTKILNIILEQYATQQDSEAKVDISKQMTQLTEQQRILNEKLNTANNQLDAIRSGATSTGNLGVARFQDFMEQKLADLEIQETALKSEITRLVQEVEFLAKRAQGDYDEVVRQQIEQDPIAANLHQQLTSLELILSGYRASFGENHRRVKETQDALDQAKDALAKRQKEIGDIVRNSQKIQSNEALTARKLEYDERVKQLNEGRAEHRKLMADRAAYEKAEAKREEARLQLEAMNALIEKYTSLLRDPFLSRIKISGATIPWEPSAPKWYVHIPGGFMLGALAGLGLAFIIELSNKLLRRPEDVRRYLHIPLLGAICHEKDDDETEGVDLLHVVRQAPYSVMSECYRQFRTNLRLSESAANKKVLLVTSPSAGDGKTTVVMNLTSTFVAEGKKVLVIDTNFRRPSMATHFPRPAQGDSVSHADFGLSNYLMGQCSDPRDILRRSETEGLDIIDSGPIPPNPAEVLGSHAMKKLLDTFRDQYDYILLDGPALLVSDAKALAALAEGTIVVFNATRTRKDEAARILADLGKIQATVVGTVLLGVENIRGGYFGELHRAYKDYHKRNEPMAKPAN